VSGNPSFLDGIQQKPIVTGASNWGHNHQPRIDRSALNGKTPSEVSRIAETNERTWERLIKKSARNARKL
jgi:hypothetical protein